MGIAAWAAGLMPSVSWARAPVVNVHAARAEARGSAGMGEGHVAPLEERVYRHRCVEAWSIVVPWAGYSLSALLNQVQPTPKAKFVAFQSYYDLGQMPQARYAGIELPYLEGLRLDEAMHPLAGLDQIGRHRATHISEPDKSDVRHVRFLLLVEFQF